MLIQKQKEELKYVLYAFCRLILWNFIYKYWLKCLVRFSVVAFGMMFWERPSEQPYSLACAILWGIAINKESWIYILIGFVIQYFITFFAIKPSLKKVFFKKYEKFELTPNFDKISWKFNFIFSLKLFALFLIVNTIFNFLVMQFGFGSKRVLKMVTFSLNSFMHLRYDEERLQALALNLPFVLLYYTAKAIIFYLLTYFTITKNAKLTKKETIS